MRHSKPRFRMKWRLERVKRRRRVVEFMAGLAPVTLSFLNRIIRSNGR